MCMCVRLCGIKVEDVTPQISTRRDYVKARAQHSSARFSLVQIFLFPRWEMASAGVILIKARNIHCTNEWQRHRKEKECTETLINAGDTTLLDIDRKIKQAKLDDNLSSMKFFFHPFFHSFLGVLPVAESVFRFFLYFSVVKGNKSRNISKQ